MSRDKFLKALNSFNAEISNMSNIEHELLNRKNQLTQSLKHIINNSDFAIAYKNNMLLDRIKDLKTSTLSKIDSWDVKLQAASPMKALSEQYADRIIFLIFGKVNAGKSSFANFLTEQFSQDQVKRFAFNNGKVEYFTDDRRFAEGVTETTATIQGVELGRNFVLLDSPGLHSVTDENGALTQRFVDSTDAVLWLTPSTSPGQVQELKDLQIELEKGKPLQPVITRSDILEEDYCEKADDIIQRYINKPTNTRKSQENDVISRISDIGLTVPVKLPVSISVRAFNEAGKTQQAFDESGLSELFARLVVLIDEANAYKVKKVKNQIIIFLEKEMLAPLQNDIIPKLQDLDKNADRTIETLRKKKDSLTVKLTSDIVIEIPSIVNQHKDSQNKKAITSALNGLIEGRINKVLTEELAEFVSEVSSISSSLSSDKIGDFENITIDITQVKGSAAKSATTGIGGIGGAYGGAIAGAELGTLIFPGVGSVVGGVIGGLLGGLLGGAAGSAAGDYFVETETVTEQVGVRADQMIDNITNTVKKSLPSMIDAIFKDAINSVQSVKQFSNAIGNEISLFDKNVQQFKNEAKL